MTFESRQVAVGASQEVIVEAMPVLYAGVIERMVRLDLIAIPCIVAPPTQEMR